MAKATDALPPRFVKIALHAGQDLEQAAAVFFRYAVQRLPARGGADRQDVVDQRMRRLGQPQQAHAAILAIEQPLDQARLLQPVEDARERDRLDVDSAP